MKKILNLLKLLALSSIVFFIGNSGNTYMVKSKIENENLKKNLSVNTIVYKQTLLNRKQQQEKAKAKARAKKVFPSFVGHLTGYSADCPGCSGNLACTGTNVKSSGVFYNDKRFGKVRIVATSSKYPCGTILRFNLPSIQSTPIIAIALDRGVSGNTVDLLTPTSSYARSYVGSIYNKKFEVLRLGW